MKSKLIKEFSLNKIIDFRNISLSRLLLFSEIIKSSTLLEIEFIKERYSRNGMYFANILQFLEKIALLRIKKNKIILTKTYKNLLYRLSSFQNKEESVRKLIVDNFLGKRNYFSEYLEDFLSKFILKGKAYIFMPTYSQILQYSHLRNFLIDLEVISLDMDSRIYVLENKYYGLLKNKYRKIISLAELLKKKKADEEIGKDAELEILKYERKRLARFPALVNRIKYISQNDVSAGYDILSFEVASFSERYIEVKAVSPIDYRFNWTRNEIEKAKLFRQQYCIYLLPCSGNKKFDLAKLKIIKNPYSNIYKNKKLWEQVQEVVCFYLKFHNSTIN